MATSGYLLEINDRFCQCPICLEQYTDPKLLPCIHRYCRNCLQQLITRSKDVDRIKCPECRKDFEVPAEGVEGFKTDFYIANVIEYIQLQKSLEEEQLKKCCDCAKEIKVTAYCFKCNDFLCNECHNRHMTKKMLKDHKPHTLSLEDIRSKNITLEKLVTLKEAPRCQRHPENLCQLCCRTCRNLPICMTCTYGSHENHKVKDVSILATEEKENLHEKLELLNQYMERMYKMSQTVTEIKKDLSSNVKDKETYFQRRYERNVSQVKTALKNMADDTRKQETDIESQKEADLVKTRKKMQEELEEVRNKYDSICNKIKTESEAQLRKLKEKQDEEIKINQDKLQRFEKDRDSLITSMYKRQKELEKKIEEISLQLESTVKRFENLSATAHSVLTTGNDWTAVQCIPDMCSASVPLSVEMNRDFPDLETFSRIKVGIKIAKHAGSATEIEGIKTNNFLIRSIKSNADDNMVITGKALYNNLISHITVINLEGKVLYQKKLESSDYIPMYFCTYISQFRIVAVCWRDDIEIYDVRDGSYTKKDISGLINSTLPLRGIKCVAYDPDVNRIFVVGDDIGDIYVFDDELKYIRTMKLPEKLKCPCDVAVFDGTLLVCDQKGGKAYAVRGEGLEAKLLHEFTKPITDGNAISVCTDKYGFVYMLWEGKESCLLVQYSHDGWQMQATMPGDKDAKFLATVEAFRTEKLVTATFRSGKLHIYDLKGPFLL